jgi:hypothetical protein
MNGLAIGQEGDAHATAMANFLTLKSIFENYLF